MAESKTKKREYVMSFAGELVKHLGLQMYSGPAPAYEYLLRKFAEGQGQSAGEFYTPKEVGWVMAYCLDPKQGQEVYDPACGSGGLLVKCRTGRSFWMSISMRS